GVDGGQGSALVPLHRDELRLVQEGPPGAVRRRWADEADQRAVLDGAGDPDPYTRPGEVSDPGPYARPGFQSRAGVLFDVAPAVPAGGCPPSGRVVDALRRGPVV